MFQPQSVLPSFSFYSGYQDDVTVPSSYQRRVAQDNEPMSVVELPSPIKAVPPHSSSSFFPLHGSSSDVFKADDIGGDAHAQSKKENSTPEEVMPVAKQTIVPEVVDSMKQLHSILKRQDQQMNNQQGNNNISFNESGERRVVVYTLHNVLDISDS